MLWTVLLTALAAPIRLEGEWVIMGDHEARTGSVSVVGCHGRRDTWRFEQQDDRVQGTFVQGHSVSGMRRTSHTRVTGRVSGVWTDHTLRLEGAEVWTTVPLMGGPQPSEQRKRQFELSMVDGHLIGTRDGKPVRLAPADLSPPSASCGPPPS